MKRQWILLADDDHEMRDVIRETLSAKVPARIVEVGNGHEALLKLQNQRFDLVITDYRMPRVNGFGLIEEISRLAEGQKPKGIIVISGFAEQSEINRLGKITFFAKPLKMDELVRASNQILGRLPETPAVVQRPSIDVSFINPFIEGTLTVLDTLCSTAATKKDAFLRTAENAGGDISSIVAMISESRGGSFAVCFEASCFLGLVNRMLGESYTEINGENQDAAGELCNQIFGFAKKKPNEMGYQIQPAIPSVITGVNHQIKHLVNGVVIAARFETEFGSFMVEAAVS